MVLAKLDEIGRPAYWALIAVTFWLWWPVGLMMLAYLAGTGRLRGMRPKLAGGHWHNMRRQAFAAGTMARGFGGSGNKAFDDYRAHTLERLEQEQAEFVEYLDRLRQARDKAEFDQFMADRGRRTQDGTAEPVQNI